MIRVSMDFVTGYGKIKRTYRIWRRSKITHLERDSQDRMYIFMMVAKYIDFSSDLNSKEEFSISGDFSGNRIARREIGSNAQEIITNFPFYNTIFLLC